MEVSETLRLTYGGKRTLTSGQDQAHPNSSLWAAVSGRREAWHHDVSISSAAQVLVSYFRAAMTSNLLCMIWLDPVRRRPIVAAAWGRSVEDCRMGVKILLDALSFCASQILGGMTWLFCSFEGFWQAA